MFKMKSYSDYSNYFLHFSFIVSLAIHSILTERLKVVTHFEFINLIMIVA